MHRVIDYCSDRLWIVIAIVILVVSTYVMLGRYLANSVQVYRTDVVELLEQRTGLHAEVGELSGKWAFFTPVIELAEVNLYQNSGFNAPIISAKKIILELDVLASLLVREPRLVTLSVYGLDLNLQRNAEGDYSLLGLNKTAPAAQGQNDFLPIMLRQDLLTLHDSKITIALEGGDSLVISDLDISFKRFAGFYQLAASTEMSGQALRLVTEIDGNPLEWAANDMDVYLRVGEGDLLRWLPKEWLTELAKRTSIALNQWHAGTEVWAKWEQGKLHSVRGFLHNDLLDFNYKKAKKPVVFSQLNSQFQLDIDTKNNMQLQLQDFIFSLGEASWPKSAVKVNLNPNAGTADVQMDRGELAPLSTLLLQSEVLNESMQGMFTTLALEGSFENLLVHLEKDSEESFYLSADFNAIQCEQWKNIPAVSGLSGQIQLKPKMGIIQIESEQLGLASPLYFRQPLLVDTLQGPVSWQVDDDQVRVQSAHLKLANKDVAGSVIFSVKVPRHKKEINEAQVKTAQQPNSSQHNIKAITDAPSPEIEKLDESGHTGPALYLAARFDHILGSSLSHYLPPALPQDVLQWLDTGLLEGQLNGRLVYHGSLSWRNPLAQHTLQTQLDFANASLDYLPTTWPPLSKANGSLFINESDVSFVVNEGEIWGSSVAITQGFVGKTAETPLVHVSLDGVYKSTMHDALRLLNETPLKEVVGGSAETWLGSGDVNGKMKLSIPLVQSEKEMALDVVTHFQKATLSLPDFDLVFSGLNGQLNYNQNDGLYSDGMQASLFGYPADIVLPKLDADDGVLFRLDLDSQISLRTLADWSHQPVLSFMNGVIDYHGELSIVNPDAVTTILRISSDTEGMGVDLPAPFAKSKDQARETLFQMLSQGEYFHYYIRQDQVFDAYLKMHGNELDTLRMVIGEERDIPEGREGVSISGSVDSLNWDVWQRDLSLLESRYDELETKGGSGNTDSADPKPESSSFIDMITGINLHVKQFDGFGLQVPNLSANVIRLDHSWWVNARSAMMKGVFKVPDDERPIAVDLDYFHMPEEETAEPAEKVFAEQMPVTESSILDMKPADFPALSVKIADLQIDGWKLGQWTFTGTPIGEFYYIDDLEVKLTDQTLNAKAIWRPDGEQSITELTGKSHGKDVGKLMAAWGYAPTIESDSASLDFELSWPHSPLDFSFDKVSGNANIKIKEGRFLDVGAASAIRVLGILNFAEVGRRLRLDFGDLIKPGHSFNRIEGPMSFHRGTLEFKKLKIHSPSSKMLLVGDVDLVDESLDMTMDVELEITKNLVAIAALVGGPAAGGGMFLIDRLIGDRLAKIASLKYIVSGTMDKPEMKLK